MGRSLRDIHGMNRKPAVKAPVGAGPSTAPALKTPRSAGPSTATPPIGTASAPAAKESAPSSGQQPKKKNRPFVKLERLPDGAVFHVAYDASKTMWSGTLTVGEQTFTGEKSAVFKLLQDLDRQYRAQGQPTQAISPAVPADPRSAQP